MKRLVSVFLCLVMVIGLTACDKPAGDNPSATPDQPGGSGAPESQEPADQPERGRPGTNLGTPGLQPVLF